MNESGDARLVLSASVILAFTVAAVKHMDTGLVALVGTVLLCLHSGVPWKRVVRQCRMLLVLVVMILLGVPWLLPEGEPLISLGSLVATTKGVTIATVLAVKILAIAMLVLVPAQLYSWSELMLGLQRLWLPRVLTQVLLLSVRYLFVLREEWTHMRTALAVRGFRPRSNLTSYRVWGQVVGQLLLRSHDHADRLGAALACRGYQGRLTFLGNPKTRRADVLRAVMLLLLAVMLWLTELGLGPWR